jgi:SAM-dependent methyltransferase
VGFDLSAAQLRAGGLDGGVAPVAVADTRALPLRTASVDALWCQAVLLHIPHAYVPDTLAGFARVVRPGGAIYLSVNEGDGEGWQSSGFDRARWYTGHREDGLRNTMPAAGFEVTYVRHTTTNRDWLSVRARRR